MHGCREVLLWRSPKEHVVQGSSTRLIIVNRLRLTLTLSLSLWLFSLNMSFTQTSTAE
eukprot:m.4747 g.4747  ORF g.4747 m.4747 type:complete len:58 (+) comp3676_c0_seq1:92-265(+)